MQPQAAGVGVGGTGFLIVVLLIVVVIIICVAMVGSLKRLRARVDDGTFGEAERRRGSRSSTGSEPGSPPQSGDEAVSPDQGGPGGAGV